jgi:hypothetical protein
VYLTVFLKQSGKLLWSGAPAQEAIAGTVGRVLWVIIGFFCIIIGFFLGFMLRGPLTIFGIVPLICGIVFVIVGIAYLSREDSPQNTEYLIFSSKIVKIKYAPPTARAYYRYYLKDEILSLSLKSIEKIVFKPWKKEDSRFMHISFHAKNYGVGSSELIQGDLVTKGTWKKKFEFQNIRNWKKIREILTEFIPNTIIDYKV